MLSRNVTQQVMFRVMNEGEQEYYPAEFHSLDAAKAEADYLAAYTDQDHSVWKTEGHGDTMTNTGDYYNGQNQ